MTGPASLPAQDYADIQNLYAYYNLVSDAGDADAYAACFTQDGSLVIPAIGLEVRGWQELSAFKAADAARRGGRLRRHWNSGLYLEADGPDSVRGRCYLHGYNGKPGEILQKADIGIYDDRIVRTAAGWRFARREITMDVSSFKAPAV
jgi:hypothetical protein